MSLSQNLKRLRLERNLTQEQLASSLGVSAQAVSKWETSETYPDGSLLLPLSKTLGVSLDELFGNDEVIMADLSRRIVHLLQRSAEHQRFRMAHDIGWQIQRGLFGWRQENVPYDPNELKERTRSSYIIDDHGFSVASNGKEPFFSVFPEMEEGFGHFLERRDELQEVFAVLSHKDTLDALVYLYHKPNEYIFEGAVLAKACGIKDERVREVLDELTLLGVLTGQDVSIDGQSRTLYCARQRPVLVALFLMAKEAVYKGAYCLRRSVRENPFFK